MELVRTQSSSSVSWRVTLFRRQFSSVTLHVQKWPQIGICLWMVTPPRLCLLQRASIWHLIKTKESSRYFAVSLSKAFLCANPKASCKTWHSIKMEACLHRLWSVQDTLETSQWLETRWLSITPEGCWMGKSSTVLKIIRSLLASISARVSRLDIV